MTGRILAPADFSRNPVADFGQSILGVFAKWTQLGQPERSAQAMNKAGSGPRREGWRKIRAALFAPKVNLIGRTHAAPFVIALFVAVSAGSHASVFTPTAR